MPVYLLDTPILSDAIRNPRGAVAGRIAEIGEEQVCTSIIVAAELRFGAAKRGSRRLTAQIDEVLASIEILAVERPVDRHYAELRVRLERAGLPIGANDLFIAAHARALGHTLVTDNIQEFARVEGLVVENWLR